MKLPPSIVAWALAVAAGHAIAAADPPGAGATRAEPRAGSVPLAVDPVEVLRAKLAERLGGRSVGPGDAPYDLQVVTRSPAPPPAPARPRTAARPAAAAAAGAAAGKGAGAAAFVPPAWDHDGDNGPEAWGRLRPEYAACASGRRQSPIDLAGGVAVELAPLAFDYRPSEFRVVDNGHTIQVNVAAGNQLEAIGRRWELTHVQFRRPGEERIAGRGFEMSLHLHHRDAQGRLAVVAVPVEAGSALPAVQSVWNHLPLERGEEWPAPVPLDVAALLPADRRYITYMGSLTTPPCTEGVLWMVMQQPVQLSEAQIGVFAHLYPMNARPLQPAGDRLVKRSK